VEKGPVAEVEIALPPRRIRLRAAKLLAEVQELTQVAIARARVEHPAMRGDGSAGGGTHRPAAARGDT